MVYKKIMDHAIEHRYALVFAGGVASAIIGKKVLESKAVKEATEGRFRLVDAYRVEAKEVQEEILNFLEINSEELAKVFADSIIKG